MALRRYHEKRDFKRTPEPRGEHGGAGGWLFVVQKHAARNLHYDFRLQIGDVLKSWAVPKGPSLDPGVRRLAVEVEDHPLAYGSFEGTIPQGAYGGGTVLLWDQGTWHLDEDPRQAYRAGKLHFTLHGKKLRGEWVLVRRSGSRGREAAGKQPWFLFKVRDAEARPGDAAGVLTREPRSVASDRTLEAIAQNDKSNGKAAPAPRTKRGDDLPRRGTGRKSKGRSPAAPRDEPAADVIDLQALGKLAGARRGPQPEHIKPQLATLVKTPPVGEEWLNEIKFDGYRMLCHIAGRSIRFVSRNGLDWTQRVPDLTRAVPELAVRSAVLDGEVVALDARGRSSFQRLQNALHEAGSAPLVYYVFDLLYLNGYQLTHVPLEQRKHVLARLIGDSPGPIRDAGYIVGKAPDFFAEAERRGLEGIICKRRDRLYRSGRSEDWLKVKCTHREEFVIGGFTRPTGSRMGFGALLLGYHENGILRYAGRVGTGFSDAVLAALHAQLSELRQNQSPFGDLQGTTGLARGVTWVRPRLVAQVAFGEWTRDGHLRHPAFLGLREDKPAAQVTRERPQALRGPHASKKETVMKQPEPADALSAVRLTNPNKVLFPEEGISKAQLAGYYTAVAEWMLPELAERPLTLVRCPQGLGGKCFYQKHANRGLPAEIGRVTIREKQSSIEYAVVNDLPGLLSLVQMNTLEFHVWGARIDNVERPDRLVFDLDPDETVAWKRVIESARQLRTLLADLDLTCFVKLTGGKGLHLVVPIARRTAWDDAKQFCRAVAEAVVRADPQRYTTNLLKSARRGRIFIDYLRNARGATAIAAYSTRARTGCPIAVPISWEELGRIESPGQFTIANVPARLARLRQDPWHELATTRQSIRKSLLAKLQS